MYTICTVIEESEMAYFFALRPTLCIAQNKQGITRGYVLASNPHALYLWYGIHNDKQPRKPHCL